MPERLTEKRVPEIPTQPIGRGIDDSVDERAPALASKQDIHVAEMRAQLVDCRLKRMWLTAHVQERRPAAGRIARPVRLPVAAPD